MSDTRYDATGIILTTEKEEGKSIAPTANSQHATANNQVRVIKFFIKFEFCKLYSVL